MRHLPAALSLALLLAGPARANLIYVLNSADASISLIDSTTREEVRRIPVLREVHHLLLTPDRSELMVGDSGGNELIFIDPATAEVKRRERFSNPYHMEYSPDGRYLVVTSLRRDQVDIYDAPTRTLLTRLRVGDKPSHLAYSPDSRMVYVTLQGARKLLAIDLAERKPVWSAEVGSQPAGVIWNRGRLIVGIMGSDHISVVNPADGKLERTIYLGRGTHTIFPSPDGQTLYATSRVDSRISVLDAATLEVKARWDIPGGPDCIAFDPDGKLWVTLRWVARIAVVDPATGVAETIPVGRSPHGIFVQPRREPLPPLPNAALPPRPAGQPAVEPEDLAPVPAAAQAAPAGAPTPVQPAVVVRPAEPVPAPAEPGRWWQRWMAR
ncbi:YncE family protein [Belnapia mucosa]|uniref:YncE family protein n=1 Tax=Belnapia mucosa TaxID=2804532 RepID=UPI001F239FE2|nr:YncE family protein [Belnapia mucosa]